MNKYKTIAEFLSDQTPNQLEQINKIRELILQVEPNLQENLKWNAPNYVYNGEDRITFNVINKHNKVKVIIHMGAAKKENINNKPVISNDEGIVEWNSDIRGTISFNDVPDILSRGELFKKVISEWLMVKV